MKKIIPNITYKSVLQPIKNIEKRNKAFHELDPQSQRMEIAWDCLMLVCGGIVGTDTGGYWSYSLNKIANKIKTPKTFQKKLNNNLPKCDVCARGGMMLSMIRLGNTISPDDDSACMGSSDNLKAFDMDTFNIMENEYEWSFYDLPYCIHTSEKLANICCNILVNGNFNTKDKTDYLIVKY